MKQLKTNPKKFWKSAMIRAVKSMAQATIAALGTTALITEVDWLTVMSMSAMTGLLSILTSISTGLPEVEEGE